MDEHDIPGVTAEAVAGAHAADVAVQGKYGEIADKSDMSKS